MKPKLLYLSRADVEAVGVSMPEIIDALAVAFREHGLGHTQMPPKPSLSSGADSFIHAMPAYIPALRAIGLKWVSGYPDNPSRNLPYISGLIVVNDDQTGLPLAVMDASWVTGMRTGAATALAARYLARPDSSTVGILGCGVQGRTNLRALKCLFPVRQVMAYDANPTNSARYAAEMAAHPEIGGAGVQVTAVDDPRAAVSGCDLVVTAGPILKIPHATIKQGWLDSGAFASMVDYDSYWDGAALQEVDKFCTDDVPQLMHYRGLGYFQSLPPIHASLGELVTGQKPGRESAGERTIACNLGLAIDDMATAPIVYRRAVERGIGVWLEL
ncbi:MAG: ornithine cyclodeaminase family protein [Anaerolineae bacterium]|jgi:ornithine cyclodeaminase/alanine dehydrogenase|nr:ornithine cyclodeaminase family protein [Anaerolineae bacterium]